MNYITFYKLDITKIKGEKQKLQYQKNDTPTIFHNI